MEEKKIILGRKIMEGRKIVNIDKNPGIRIDICILFVFLFVLLSISK